MVDGSVGNEAESGLVDELPVLHVLVHCGRLELRLLAEVEDLERSRLGLESDDLALPVHDGTVGLDGTSGDIVAVLQVDDDDFGRAAGLLFSDANVRVGLECLEENDC